jgi:uncharacterized protein YndB with AHSA1/START domain
MSEEVRFTRVIESVPEEVFDAFTNPAARRPSTARTTRK